MTWNPQTRMLKFHDFVHQTSKNRRVGLDDHGDSKRVGNDLESTDAQFKFQDFVHQTSKNRRAGLDDHGDSKRVGNDLESTDAHVKITKLQKIAEWDWMITETRRGLETTWKSIVPPREKKTYIFVSVIVCATSVCVTAWTSPFHGTLSGTRPTLENAHSSLSGNL